MKIDFERAEAIRGSTLFRRSNKYWNKYGFNSRANIGHLMKLINEMKPKNLNDWIIRYLESGKEYEDKLKHNIQANPCNYGRTKYQLKKIASDFHEELVYQGFNIDFKTTYDFVLIRVLYETWLGYSREKHVFNVLKSVYPHLEIRHADPIIDIEMAVDFEILKNGKLLLGIQVKSNNVSAETIRMNQKKNARYTSQYGADVFYVVYFDGKVQNLKELSKTLRRVKF